MNAPLMPKATALWLLENTALTFDQIAHFCHIHPLEVQALADEEIGMGLNPFDPIENNQLTKEEIEKAEQNPDHHLEILPLRTVSKKSQSKYTPLSRRRDRPDGIAWLLKHYPSMTDRQIIRLVRTTPKTIENVRMALKQGHDKVTPRNPTILSLCTQKELDDVIQKLDL